jgi:predicted PurR-regulated permease PerM
VTEYVLARGLYRGAICLVALVALLVLGLQVKWLLVLLFAAGIIAAGMAPIVKFLTASTRAQSWRWRPPPALVIIGVYVLVGAFFLVLGAILVQAALEQGTTLVQQVPTFALKLQEWFAAASTRSVLLAELDPWSLIGGTRGVTEWTVSNLGRVLNAATIVFAIFGGAINVIFVLFVALYLTLDGSMICDYLLVFLPRSRRPQWRRMVEHIATRLGQWVVGELIVILIVGTGAAVAFSIIGVPGAAFLGILWGIAELVPGIGPFIAAVPSILLGFVAGPETGVVATIFTIVWSQMENNVIVPRVMGKAVKLNPLVVLVAILTGYELLGLAGALFAVPLAASLAVIVDEFHHERLLADQEALDSRPVSAWSASETS